MVTTTPDDPDSEQDGNTDAADQSALTCFASDDLQATVFTPAEDIPPVTGVRDLRDSLEWYRSAHTHTPEGPPLPISGVWEVICGRSHKSITADNGRIETLSEMVEILVENREQFVENNQEFSPEHIDRIIGLLRGLNAVDHEYRIYGEDREPTSQFDYPVRCFVGLYHVTDRTTILTYQHKSPGMAHTVNTLNGIEAPRMEIEEKLWSDIFDSDKYEYTRLDIDDGE